MKDAWNVIGCAEEQHFTNHICVQQSNEYSFQIDSKKSVNNIHSTLCPDSVDG